MTFKCSFTTLTLTLTAVVFVVVLLLHSEQASGFSSTAPGPGRRPRRGKMIAMTAKSKSKQPVSFHSNIHSNIHSNSNIHIHIHSNSQQWTSSSSSSRLSSSYDVNASVNGSVASTSTTNTNTNSHSHSSSASNTLSSALSPALPALSPPALSPHHHLSPIKAQFVRAGMVAFIVSMCLALPLTLMPQYVAYKLKILRGRQRKERLALSTGQFCARWLLRLFPFCQLNVVTDRTKADDIDNINNINKNSNNDNDNNDNNKNTLPDPAVWVCNHTSMLDVFLLLAADRRLRGRNKRPLKIVYWQQLENNPVTKLLFRQAGFIPVQMAPGAPGTANDYDVSSFKKLLLDSKQALADGFDLAILPEGQLNPAPEVGLLPVFSGAFTIARLAKNAKNAKNVKNAKNAKQQRPVVIHLMALHGAHHLWHPVHALAAKVPTGRTVTVRAYDRHAAVAAVTGGGGGTVGGTGGGTGTSNTGNRTAVRTRTFRTAREFCQTFTTVVGHFGRTGRDLPAAELEEWLTTGAAWDKVLAAEQVVQAAATVAEATAAEAVSTTATNNDSKSSNEA